MARTFYVFEVKFHEKPAGFFGKNEHRTFGYYDTDDEAIADAKKWASDCNMSLDLSVTRFEDTKGGGVTCKIYEDTLLQRNQQPSMADRLALTPAQKACLKSIVEELRTASELGLIFVAPENDFCDIFAYNGREVHSMVTDPLCAGEDGEYTKVNLGDLTYCGDNPVYWMNNNENIYVKMKQ